MVRPGLHATATLRLRYGYGYGMSTVYVAVAVARKLWLHTLKMHAAPVAYINEVAINFQRALRALLVDLAQALFRRSSRSHCFTSTTLLYEFVSVACNPGCGCGNVGNCSDV
eukprot:1138506-Pelagomonas_calceolata.AAC.18